MAELYVKELTDEEKAKARDQFPEADIKDWSVADEHGIVSGYFDSKKEAEAFQRELQTISLVENDFRYWAQKTASRFGISSQEVTEICPEVKFQ